MQSRIQKVIGIGVGAAAIATTVGTGTAALADPPKPAAVTIAGVGSNTTQFFTTKWAANYNALKTKVGVVGSWDATGSANIVTKKGCPSIVRPNGSSAGISALLADTSGKCIDFARSSRAKKTDGTENSLAFFQFAKDNVAWSKAANSVVPNGTALTVAQLAAIYECLPTASTWNQVVKGAPADRILPYLPQDGSGTRSFFLTALGAGTAITPGACVNSSVEENSGTGVVASAGAKAKDVIYPYSSGDWVAQQNKAGGQKDVRAGMTIATTAIAEGSKKFTAVKLVSGSKTKYTTNPTFAPDFTRNLYNVVKLVNGAVPANLAALFSSTGYLCKSEGAVIKNFGFSPEPAGKCGLKS